MAGSLTQQTFVWDRNDGAISIYSDGLDLDGKLVLPPYRLPQGIVFQATNVDLSDDAICRPRQGTVAFSTSGSPPTTETRYLYVQRSSNFTTSSVTSTLTETLWAFASNGSSAMTAHSWNGSTWTSHTLTDTAASLAQPHCVQYNGKLFAAYNSANNRLHCYDGSTWRRVGVNGPAAATVADTGTGTYAATLRYYKVQMAILDASSNVVACSELGPSVSFTPSGAGTHARITKPATVDSATHWRVWASIDGVNYGRLTAYLSVGATTYDDNVVWSAAVVAGLDQPPEAGLFVPPPSARFLATDGTRLLMAGSFETSASSGETTPSAKRVWFTRPLGATDQGDDESITQTAVSRYHIDIDDPTDATITGLAVMSGIVYVLFPQSVWRLIPTGLSDVPYRAEQVSASAGALSQYAVAVGPVADSGEEAIYMVSERAGFNRVSASGGVEWLGRGVIPRVLPNLVSDVYLTVDPVKKDLWVVVRYNGGSAKIGAVDLTRFRRYGNEFYGGMRQMVFTTRRYTVTVAHGLGMVFGGINTSNSAVVLDRASGRQDSSSDYTATVLGPAIHDVTRYVTVGAPMVQFGLTALGSGEATVGYQDRYAEIGPTDVSVLQFSPTGTLGAKVRAHGVELANAREPMPYVTLVGNNNTTAIELVAVPYQLQEPL